MKKILTALALAACALTANAALVATGQLTLNGYEHSPATIPQVDTAVYSELNFRDNQRVGSLSATYNPTVVNSGPLVAGIPFNVFLFCVDITEGTANFGSATSYDLNVVGNRGDDGAFSTQQLELLGKLFNRTTYSSAFGTFDTVEAAALQLAIWEIVYDSGSLIVNNGNGNPFDDGNFRADHPNALNVGSTAEINAANTLLLNLAGDNLALGQIVSFNNLATGSKNNGLQDFIAYVPVGTFGCNESDCGGTVPEPGSMALAASALFGLGIIGRRRKLKVVSE